MDFSEDYSFLNIVNSIVSQNSNIERVLEELLVLILNKFQADYADIYCYYQKESQSEYFFHKLVTREKGSLINLDLNNIPPYITKTLEKRETVKLKNGYVIPLLFSNIKVGVLSLMYKNVDNMPDIRTEKFLNVFISHLSSIILNLRNIDDVVTTKKGAQSSNKSFIKGIGISGGIASGIAVSEASIKNRVKKVIANAGDKKSGEIISENEIELFEKAVEYVKTKLNEAEEKIRRDAGEDVANIFLFHKTLLEDKEFYGSVSSLIFDKKLDSITAIESYFSDLKAKISPNNQRLSADISDLENQLSSHIKTGGALNFYSVPETDFIYICKQLLPSDIIKLSGSGLKGLVEAEGGITSHAAILSKSLNIPLISGIGSKHSEINDGDELIIDSSTGLVLINPSPVIKKEYVKISVANEKRKKVLVEHIQKDVFTVDGQKLNISANIGMLSEIKYAKDYKADRIGLYRTEFPFLIRHDFPTLHEQYSIYSKALESFNGSIIFRTLDVGADKAPSYINFKPENNPVLGKRSIRIMMDLPEEFMSQISAIYKASVHGDARIMFPMVSSVDEVLKLKKIIDECKLKLKQNGDDFVENIPIGIMIEVPSSVIIIDKILKYVDFVSIGTNDLIQYTIGIERDNSEIMQLYQPLHPAIIRSIKRVVDECKKAGKEVSICGEMASEPLCFIVLAGLGIVNFSMNVHSIPVIKNIVSKMSLEKAKEIAEAVINMDTSSEIEEFVLKEISILV